MPMKAPGSVTAAALPQLLRQIPLEAALSSNRVAELLDFRAVDPYNFFLLHPFLLAHAHAPPSACPRADLASTRKRRGILAATRTEQAAEAARRRGGARQRAAANTARTL